MNDNQKGGYWRRWRAACIAQGWTRLGKDELDAKRYAVHANCGCPPSMKDFNTKSHPDKVFAAFQVLADGDNVAHRVELDAQLTTDKGDRKRIVYRIEMSLPKAYVEEIMREKFGTIKMAELDLHQLEQLRITVIERKRARTRREAIAAVTAPVAPELADNIPF